MTVVEQVEPDPDQEATPCPGRCNQHWRQKSNLNKLHADLKAVPGAPSWCQSCEDRIRRDIARIPELATAAMSRTDGKLNHPSSDTDKTRQSTRAGSPALSSAWVEVEAKMSVVFLWEDMLREHLGHTDVTAPRPQRLERRGVDGTVTGIGPVVRDPAATRKLTAGVAYLLAHLRALMCHPTAAEAGHDFISMAQTLERVSGRDKLTHRLPAPCPSCNCKALQRFDGADQVDCKVCGRSWPQEDYNRLVLVLADEKRRAGA